MQRKAARQDGPDRRTGGRGSKRWARTAARIGRIHARAADLRRDALHQATTRLAQRHQVVVVENLNVAGMSRRKPGAGRGGRGLNRAIADAAPGEVRRQLGYKTAWYGSQLVGRGPVVPQLEDLLGLRRGESQARPGRPEYQCGSCGAVLDRDLNAAINLARLSEHAPRVEGRPAGSGPVAGRGAIRKTRPPTGAAAGGDETSTPHSGQQAAGQTGTAPPQGEAA